ncbi:hypothetical protein PHET_02312 [Paragonimus heterotremus]|uniref:Uncharacterized protein n=1 Tax=Paragonimus heterotremus TaxID=100268 RepID=A0A8J4WIP4_9TREM|nr:hypothetical protein PHET_02312 [Paragonimus heterotremus]
MLKKTASMPFWKHQLKLVETYKKHLFQPFAGF